LLKFAEPEFYILFNNYIASSLEFLRSNYALDNISKSEGSNPNRMWYLLIRNWKKIEALPEYQKLIGWIDTNPDISQQFGKWIGYSHIRNQISKDDVFRRLLYDALIASDLMINSEVIQKKYSELENFLLSKKLKVTIWTPLVGLENNFDVENGLQIQRLNEDESFKYNKKMHYFIRKKQSLIVHEFTLPKIISKDLYMSKKEDQQLYQKTSLTQRLIEAMRIYKSGYFGTEESHLYSPFVHFLFTDHRLKRCGLNTAPPSDFENRTYRLNGDEITKFRTFWNDFKGIGHDKRTSFIHGAINRFMTSYERENFEDRIVDLFIALEILFKGKKGASDILFHRISVFFEPNNKTKREKIYKFLEKAYEIRSDIVHGGDEYEFVLDGKKIYAWDILNDLEEYVRSCIKRLVPLLVTTEFSKKEITDMLGNKTKK